MIQGLITVLQPRLDDGSNTGFSSAHKPKLTQVMDDLGGIDSTAARTLTLTLTAAWHIGFYV
jgi:hypothetical protein